MAYKKESARTTATVATAPMIIQNSLSPAPEDCELLVEPEGVGKRGVEAEPEDCGKGGVEVESEYDLELRFGGNVSRPGMGRSSLLTVQNKTVHW
jgi:hypothetical protein